MGDRRIPTKLGIYDKNDPWLNGLCVCGHIRYRHKPEGDTMIEFIKLAATVLIVVLTVEFGYQIGRRSR